MTERKKILRNQQYLAKFCFHWLLFRNTLFLPISYSTIWFKVFYIHIIYAQQYDVNKVKKNKKAEHKERKQVFLLTMKGRETWSPRSGKSVENLYYTFMNECITNKTRMRRRREGRSNNNESRHSFKNPSVIICYCWCRIQ